MPVTICLCIFICSCVSVEGVQRLHKVNLVQACQFILSIFTFMFVPEVQRSFHPWKIKCCTRWTLLKVNRATALISFAKKWYKIKQDEIKYCTKWTLFKATALTPLAKSHSANCTLFLWMPTALLLNLNTPGILRERIFLLSYQMFLTSLSILAFCIISCIRNPEMCLHAMYEHIVYCTIYNVQYMIHNVHGIWKVFAGGICATKRVTVRQEKLFLGHLAKASWYWEVSWEVFCNITNS